MTDTAENGTCDGGGNSELDGAIISHFRRLEDELAKVNGADDTTLPQIAAIERVTECAGARSNRTKSEFP